MPPNPPKPEPADLHDLYVLQQCLAENLQFVQAHIALMQDPSLRVQVPQGWEFSYHTDILERLKSVILKGQGYDVPVLDLTPPKVFQ